MKTYNFKITYKPRKGKLYPAYCFSLLWQNEGVTNDRSLTC